MLMEMLKMVDQGCDGPHWKVAYMVVILSVWSIYPVGISNVGITNLLESRIGVVTMWRSLSILRLIKSPQQATSYSAGITAFLKTGNAGQNSYDTTKMIHGEEEYEIQRKMADLIVVQQVPIPTSCICSTKPSGSRTRRNLSTIWGGCIVYCPARYYTSKYWKARLNVHRGKETHGVDYWET